MKKILIALLVVCLSVVCLASCASMDSYIENLGDDYEFDILDRDEIEYLAKIYGIDEDDYYFVEVVEAYYEGDEDESDDDRFAYIFEFEDDAEAERFLNEVKASEMFEYIVEIYEDDFKVEAVADENYVLVGAASVINVALGN